MSVELVLATPLLLLLLLVAVQSGVWWHATHIADTVAAHALAAARVQDGSPTVGQQTGEQVWAQLGTGVLRQASIEVTRTAAGTRVEVRGLAEPVVPGLRLPVAATAVGTTEPPP